MAVTETPPETVAATSADASAAPAAATGLAAVLGTGDHKVIGRIYIVASLVLGAVVIGLAQAFGIEAISTEGLDVFASSNAYQAFTLMRVGSIFLLALPLVIGVAMVVTPLQVGARSVAFPRAAAASLWGWLLGSILLLASYLMNGGPGGGSSEGVRLWIASMGLLVVSVLVAAVCLATTVFALRAPGMSMDRVPMYAWSVAVAAVLWLLTLPVLLGLLVIMYVDNRHAGSIFNGSAGSLYAAVYWIFRNPQIYVVAIPVLGFVLDVVATSSKARGRGRSIAQPAIGAFGTLSFGAFLVAPTAAGLESATVVVMGVLAVVPVLAVAAVAADGFRKPGFSLNAGVLYAAVALLVLVLTTIAGAVGAVPGVLDAPGEGTVGDNIFFLGVSHGAVLAAVIGALGGVWWWATKVGRQPADAKLGMLAPLVLLVGAVLVVIPDLVSGIAGDGRELLADYSGGIEALNVVVAIGVGVLALGLLAALASFAPLLKVPANGSPTDPWEGQTLEWLAPSPPPVENFPGELAVVTSAEPLIDLREEK
jgi:heme/copper-type cytochrome/quinol oxidase subunit 1